MWYEANTTKPPEHSPQSLPIDSCSCGEAKGILASLHHHSPPQSPSNGLHGLRSRRLGIPRHPVDGPKAHPGAGATASWLCLKGKKKREQPCCAKVQTKPYMAAWWHRLKTIIRRDPLPSRNSRKIGNPKVDRRATPTNNDKNPSSNHRPRVRARAPARPPSRTHPPTPHTPSLRHVDKVSPFVFIHIPGSMFSIKRGPSAHR